MSKIILIVEDDARIAGLISKYLEAESFLCELAGSGPEALILFNEVKPDLVILDMMLPMMDGSTVCEKIRALSEVPIIMVTALTEDSHRLEGFSKGADDYICKPFNPRELLARVKAVLRRSGKEPIGLSHGSIYINREERIVRVGKEIIPLTQTEYALLATFLANPSRVFSREELLEGSHMEYSESSLRSIDFHIKNLRRKINVTPDTSYIKAVYGIGYKFS